MHAGDFETCSLRSNHSDLRRKRSLVVRSDMFETGKLIKLLGALRAPTSSWRPFGPLDFVIRALRALRPCDPRNSDWIVC